MTIVSSDRSYWLAQQILPHEPALRSWLRHKRSLPLEVDDIVQETYAILAGLESVSNILNPKAYFFQTAYSLALRQWRHQKVISIRHLTDFDHLHLGLDAPSPETQWADREALFQLFDIIKGFPAQAAEALRLRKIEGLSQKEAADKMGISESTLEKHYAKAIKLLMDRLGHGGNDQARASRAMNIKDLYDYVAKRTGLKN